MKKPHHTSKIRILHIFFENRGDYMKVVYDNDKLKKLITEMSNYEYLKQADFPQKKSLILLGMSACEKNYF